MTSMQFHFSHTHLFVVLLAYLCMAGCSSKNRIPYDVYLPLEAWHGHNSEDLFSDFSNVLFANKTYNDLLFRKSMLALEERYNVETLALASMSYTERIARESSIPVRREFVDSYEHQIDTAFRRYVSAVDVSLADVLPAEVEPNINTFPLPAPRPNETTDLPGRLWKYDLGDGQPVRWGTVADRLSDAAKSVDYRYGYYRVGSHYGRADGFALVCKPRKPEKVSRGILGTSLRYRMLVFVLVPGVLPESNRNLTEEDVVSWTGFGVEDLPQSMAQRKVEDRERIWCLSYLLERSALEGEDGSLRPIEDDRNFFLESDFYRYLERAANGEIGP